MTDQTQPMLFDEQAAPVPEVLQLRPLAAGVARVLMPNRTQLELRASDLESLLPEGHRARLVWAWVERPDLSGMYAGIRVVEGGSGRTAIAPEILFALWLYATLDGVGSARAVARLTQEHDAYRWICGGVSVNYHTLSDFRSAHGEALDGLLTDSVAALLSVGAVTLKRSPRTAPACVPVLGRPRFATVRRSRRACKRRAPRSSTSSSRSRTTPAQPRGAGKAHANAQPGLKRP